MLFFTFGQDTATAVLKCKHAMVSKSFIKVKIGYIPTSAKCHKDFSCRGSDAGMTGSLRAELFLPAYRLAL